jgi:hypothetical protein
VGFAVGLCVFAKQTEDFFGHLQRKEKKLFYFFVGFRFLAVGSFLLLCIILAKRNTDFSSYFLGWS